MNGFVRNGYHFGNSPFQIEQKGLNCTPKRIFVISFSAF